MRSKLETSIAQLHKLKNQIRVELNQIRPYHSPINLEKKDHSSKKFFAGKFIPTDIVHPSGEDTRKEGKRYYNDQVMVHAEINRSTEKKHFEHHYSDSVNLTNNIRRKTSSYFNIKKEPATASPAKYESTSLAGIGARDKSNSFTHLRPCIRVYRNKETNVI